MLILAKLCVVLALLISETLWLRVCPQVRSDYMQQYASKVSDGMALQLGCLEIR